MLCVSFFFRRRRKSDFRQVFQVPQMLRSRADQCQIGGLRHAAARQEGVLRSRAQRLANNPLLYSNEVAC